MSDGEKITPLYEPWGPYKLPKKADGTFDYKAFKKEAQDDTWTTEPGCYVICQATPRGLKAIYIGKSDSSLLGRVYQHRGKISDVMADLGNRTSLEIFLLYYEKSRGQWNKSLNALLERELIRTALLNKVPLENIQQTRGKTVGVAGVINVDRGKRLSIARAASAVRLRRAFGMKD